MRNAQQRGALCAHGELRNCLYQRQFRARRRHTTLVPPRGAPQGRWEFLLPPCKGESCVMHIGAVRCARMASQGITFISGNLCPTRGESLACKRISTKWRTSAAREVPQAAHYLGVAKRCRGEAVTVGVENARLRNAFVRSRKERRKFCLSSDFA